MNEKIISALVSIVLSGLLLTSLSLLLPGGKVLTSQQAIEEVKKQYEFELMALDGVVGVAISECEGKPCLEVYLEKESQSLVNQIPAQIDGFKVKTKVTGAIEALPQ